MPRLEALKLIGWVLLGLFVLSFYGSGFISELVGAWRHGCYAP
jgi:hypothetical protein